MDAMSRAVPHGSEKERGRMSDRRLIAVELTDKHIDILNRALIETADKSYWDADENVADAIIELIEWAGEMI